MKNPKSTIITLAMVILALCAFSQTAQSQDADELLNQLTGQAPAPSRNAEQLTEAYQKVIDYLMPYMMAENVASQYQPQIALQDLGSYASRPGAELERQTCAKVMIKTLEEREMPNTLRNWFVLQIQRIGKGESVPALTKLLSNEDKHLRDYARRALEKNPDPSASDVLLKELGSATETAWKIGLINSLGERKAEPAVPTIIKALNDSDPKVAGAAVTALILTANQAGIQALSDILKNPASPIYVKAAQGLIDIAQEKAANRQTADAGKIFDSVYENTSKSNSAALNTAGVRVAAINGIINCNPDKGATLIAEFIKDDNPKIRSAAVTGARQSSSDAPAQALYKILAQLKPDTQVQVLGLIGDRKDLSAANYAKEMLDSQNEQVRLASISAMSKLGDVSSAEALFDIAVNGSGNDKAAAHLGLVQMSGTNVEVLINSNTVSGDVPARVEAISLTGERHMSGSAKALLGFAADDNEQISSAAFKALAEVADASSIPTLVSLISNAKSASARNTGVSTLKSILTNADDKDDAADVVIDQINKSSGQVKTSLLTSLNALGGPKALAIVTEAAKSSDQAYKDAAVRTLCDWPDYEATKPLLEIASNSSSSLAHHVLAIRGILRLVDESSTVPAEDKANLCLTTYDIARRNEEKGQIISAMGALPTSQVSEKLLEIAQGNNLKAEAAMAALQLAGNMLRTNAQAAQAIAQKILDMNISNEINIQAQNVVSGRMRGPGGFGAGGRTRGGRGASQRRPVVRPDRAARLNLIKDLDTQLTELREAIEKAPAEDPDFSTLQGEELTEAMEYYTTENDAITAIQQTLASLRGISSSGRGGMGFMGSTGPEDVLSELRVLARSVNATKTVESLDTLIKEAQTQTSGRGGFGSFGGAGGGNFGGRTRGGNRGTARGGN
jgi:HEAT repeat protein